MKTEKFCPLDDLKPQMPDYVSISFIPIICTILPTLSSREKSIDFELATFLIKLRKTQKNIPILASCKIPESLEKSPLLKVEKYPDFRVTCCLQNVSTDAKLAHIESE
jgi:hypothetical protein